MPPATLQEALCDLHAAAMIRQAEVIRDWPTGHERHEQAMMYLRLALWEQGMGRITHGNAVPHPIPFSVS